MSEPARYRRRIPPEVREQMVRRRREGATNVAIAGEFGIHRASVGSILRQSAVPKLHRQRCTEKEQVREPEVDPRMIVRAKLVAAESTNDACADRGCPYRAMTGLDGLCRRHFQLKNDSTTDGGVCSLYAIVGPHRER
jgi:transposase-like protein